MVGMVSSHLGSQRVVGPKAADLGDMLLYATVDYSQVVAGLATCVLEEPWKRLIARSLLWRLLRFSFAVCFDLQRVVIRVRPALLGRVFHQSCI
jgi:hypothetical protein